VNAAVPTGPLETDAGGFVPEAERSVILAGVVLGAWDRWVAGWLDTSTALTIASWIARTREAGQSQ
jgi:hypothetical protein